MSKKFPELECIYSGNSIEGMTMINNVDVINEIKNKQLIYTESLKRLSSDQVLKNWILIIGRMIIIGKAYHCGTGIKINYLLLISNNYTYEEEDISIIQIIFNFKGDINHNLKFLSTKILNYILAHFKKLNFIKRFAKTEYQIFASKYIDPYDNNKLIFCPKLTIQIYDIGVVTKDLIKYKGYQPSTNEIIDSFVERTEQINYN